MQSAHGPLLKAYLCGCWLQVHVCSQPETHVIVPSEVAWSSSPTPGAKTQKDASRGGSREGDWGAQFAYGNHFKLNIIQKILRARAVGWRAPRSPPQLGMYQLAIGDAKAEEDTLANAPVE